ncbi:hypothetical protein ACFSF0_07700 [Ottowia flava]|uniref:Uncharacterized protein n=1 Tax=Ottowia flava TaxID=2675430 RepID=A0ABW4KUQ5_9BURK|nr:hypothetical protein [Ottowia sp. GY511]
MDTAHHHACDQQVADGNGTTILIAVDQQHVTGLDPSDLVQPHPAAIRQRHRMALISATEPTVAIMRVDWRWPSTSPCPPEFSFCTDFNCVETSEGGRPTAAEPSLLSQCRHWAGC